jgi:predicted ATPase/class 3 adenylate cyclase
VIITRILLFTDIEGSTKLWEQHPEAMQTALARHDAILRNAIETHHGYVFKTVGDAFCAAFATSRDALDAALAAQCTLHAEPWRDAVIKVRMGLNTGAPEVREGDYFGSVVNRVARLHAVGHGGQVLLSQATYGLVRDDLPPQITLRDMGACRLKDLALPEHIFQMIAPDLPSEFPPLKTLDYRPNNLPAQTTSFVGQEQEIAEVRELMLNPGVRLLTLSGPGGTGKTRLALQVAAGLLDAFEHGVFFVALAPVHDPDDVLSAIAQTLDVRFLEGQRQSLLERLQNYLQNEKLLLVLDNFEQVAAAGAQITELLAVVPDLKVLIISRVLLRVYGEQEYSVPPLLALPDPLHPPAPAQLMQYAAVCLFIERARAVQADFAVDNANAPAVAELCYRLGGSPLAIELAAAWSDMLTPEEVLAELAKSLDILETDLGNIPDRQRSMRAVFDYSWQLLTAQEQTIFQALGVFRGGFTREAAQAVAGASLRDLRSLTNKSLIHREEEGRYTMHELLRQYAEERLSHDPDIAETVRDRHCVYYFAFLAQREALHSAAPRAVRQEIAVDSKNVRTAWDWAVEHVQADRLTEAANALAEFYWCRSAFKEGASAFQAAVDKLSPLVISSPANRDTIDIYIVRTRALLQTMGYLLSFLHMVGQIDLFHSTFRQALKLLDRAELVDLDMRKERALILLRRGIRQDNTEETQRFLQESVMLYRELDDRAGLSSALNFLGQTMCELGNLSEAQRLFKESLALQTEYEETELNLYVLPAVALFLVVAGDCERAIELYALASHYPFVANSRWFDDVIGQHIAAVAATLPLDVVTAAQARGRARDLHATAQELLTEFADHE